MAKTFVVTLKKSTIGCTPTQIKTVEALGLKRLNHSVTMTDNAANRGQLFKVQHLIEVAVKK